MEIFHFKKATVSKLDLKASLLNKIRASDRLRISTAATVGHSRFGLTKTVVLKASSSGLIKTVVSGTPMLMQTTKSGSKITRADFAFEMQ